ncbi:hypothetical protein BC477_12635 [Clavibacter michiganensis subsp. michiganensis]|uniref:Uncharacterized protein n=1 Tax=Clavibacter michiganensis subsp. michiganensis TaxID=33013 RepID=A0A251XHV2_CLAMM|nr:hypothetical protein BC477_12635 [Clavibacter michiganensis subsp. michiganensis]OUE02644.1 hypothetical protein CMMCAS07_11540 [Clavibacter michiganensis subsp. michiganensis]
MLDSITLRVAFGVTTLTLFLLFALVTFRATRSPFSFWWCTALVLFMGDPSPTCRTAPPPRSGATRSATG